MITGNPAEDGTGTYHYYSTAVWEETLWRQIAPIYEAGFAAHGRKPEHLIRRMLMRGIGRLHAAYLNGQAAAMALTGADQQLQVLIIDYLTVGERFRRTGVGRRFVESILAEAKDKGQCRGMVVEVEAGDSPEDLGRIRFWQRCGFRLADDYVHQYIWVPETYRAMALELPGADPLPAGGQELFASILRFHKQAYRK